VPIVLKSGSFIFLETSGPLQAHKGIALPFTDISKLTSVTIQPWRQMFPLNEI